jgi:hypothetical protein
MQAEIKEQVKQGIVEGFREITKDKEMLKDFWRGGWEELVRHSSDASSQWIGKRVFTWIVGVVVTAGLVWLANSGRLK